MSVLLFFGETTPTTQPGSWSPYAHIILAVSHAHGGKLRFMDETGLNPLPVGVSVQIYPAQGVRNASTLVGSGYIGLGGYIDIVVQPGINYAAVFSGTQAPIVDAYFTGGN